MSEAEKTSLSIENERNDNKRKVEETAPIARKKPTKRERKRGDPILHTNIDYLLEAAKDLVNEARTPVKAGLKFNWPLIKRAQSYIKELRGLASKSTYRLPRQIKHQFCKKCNIYRMPTVTSENKIMKKDGYKFLNMKCLICKAAKKLIIKKGIRKRKEQTANKNAPACVHSVANQEGVGDNERPIESSREETLQQ